MDITLTVNTGEPLTGHQRSILLAIAGVTAPTAAQTPAPKPAAEEKPAEPSTPEPEPKATPAPEPAAEEKPKRTRRTKAQIEADKEREKMASIFPASDEGGELDQQMSEAVQRDADPEPKPEPAAAEGPTLQQAIEAATDLVAKGQRAKVTAAMKSVDISRVRELEHKPGLIQQFLDAL